MYCFYVGSMLIAYYYVIHIPFLFSLLCRKSVLKVELLKDQNLKSHQSVIIPYRSSGKKVDKISSKFILCDHVFNSDDHSVLQSIEITRRNFMLITLRALRVKAIFTFHHINNCQTTQRWAQQSLNSNMDSYCSSHTENIHGNE